MSHHGTEIKTIAYLLCSEQYFGLLVIGSLTFDILHSSSESNSPLFRKPAWIANEVRLMNESAEGIKLLWDGHCSWFQAVRQAGMEDWWIAIVHSLALSVTPDVWPGSPSTSDTPQTEGLIEWLDTEWYLLLQLSILTTLLLANIKMDHSVYSHQVKCERIWAAWQSTYYVICCFGLLTEKCMHLCIFIRTSNSYNQVNLQCRMY